MIKYHVEYRVDGVMVKKGDVVGELKGLVGDYVGGKPYGPVPDAIAAFLPYHMRAAFWRAANGWYTSELHNSPPFWRFDLTRKHDGAPMGAVFATIETESV